MKVLSFIGLGFLLASPLLALPAEEGMQPEQMNELEKRDGHIKVQTWSGGACGGKGQGTTDVGTGGKCVNMSKAGSVHIGGPSADNPGGCAYVHASYFKNTGCHGFTGEGIKYGPHSCVKPLHASALMKCVA